MNKPITLCILLLAPLLGLTFGQNLPTTRNSLVGLEGVYIFVEPMLPEVEERGITDAVLAAEVERRLRAAGVEVLDVESTDAAPPYLPTLYVDVTALVEDGIEQCVYGIRIELIQSVKLERDDTLPALHAPTWSVTGVGIHTRGWRQAILNDTGDFVDEFADAFLQANQRFGVVR